MPRTKKSIKNRSKEKFTFSPHLTEGKASKHKLVMNHWSVLPSIEELMLPSLSLKMGDFSSEHHRDWQDVQGIHG